MSVGTATAIALAASAASSAYAAHAQASGAKKAAKTQSDASDKALALQSQLANRNIDTQNQLMFGSPGGGGGYQQGGMGGGGMSGGGGLQGMYAPYTSTGGATLSALHQFLGIPGAEQSQTMVPYGAYGQPMRPPQFGGGPMPGSGGQAMSYRQGGFQGAPGVPMPQPTVMAPTGQLFQPRVGPAPIQPRAAGGPVQIGQQYLVGEKGPELFSPAQPGVINSNEDTRRNLMRQQQDQWAMGGAQAGAKPMAMGGSGGTPWGTPNGVQTTPWGTSNGMATPWGQSSGSGWMAPTGGGTPWGQPAGFQGGIISGYNPSTIGFHGGTYGGYDPGTGPRNPMAMNQDDAATLAGLYQDYQSRRGPRV